LVGLLELSEKFLVSAAADATLRIWDPVTGHCLANLLGHPAAITCFHHDTKLNRIVSGSDGGVKIWELSSFGYGTSASHPPPIPETSRLSSQLLISQTPNGTQPLYGRHVSNLLQRVQGVWRVRMDDTKIVCACQRESGTWFEVLDFSVGAGEHINAPGDNGEDEDVEMEM
jgi:F-box and WD-40 domain protein CDC4